MFSTEKPMYVMCIFIYLSEKTVSVTPSVLLYPHKGGGASLIIDLFRLSLSRLSKD